VIGDTTHFFESKTRSTLTRRADDGNVVARFAGGALMLFKTHTAFQDRLAYSKSGNGSWRAEFHGPVTVIVEEPTLERCRSRALDEFDTKLSTLIKGLDLDDQDGYIEPSAQKRPTADT
jgi:hypothetical protein